MKKRIGILIPRLAIPGQQIGGAERTAIRFANGIAAARGRTDLIVFQSGSILQDEISQGVRIVNLRVHNWLEAFLRLRKYTIEVHPLAIFAQDNRAGMLVVLLRELTNLSTEIILTVHATLSYRWREASLLKRFLSRALIRPFHLRADAIVAVSRGTAADLVLLMRLPRDNVKVIYNPLISEELFAKAKAKAKAKE